MTDTVPGHAPFAPAAPRKTPAICVFCGSSFGNDSAYREAAERLGTALAANGFSLVFGGGRLGLMGVVATAVAKGGGKILGIIPDFLRHIEPPVDVVSEIVVTEGLSERKARMMAASDGFAVLPGGLGTLDELADVFTGAQLDVHEKPIVLINTKDYFAPFLRLVDHMIAEGFARAEVKRFLHVVPTPEDAVAIFAQKCTSPSDGTEAAAQFHKTK